MNNDIAQFDVAESPIDEFLELAVIHLEGCLTNPQRDRFNTLLAEDAANRDRFVAVCTHASILASCVGLDEDLDNSEYAGSDSELIEQGIFSKTVSEPIAYEAINLSLLPSLVSPSFVGGPVFSYMVATVLLCMMLLGGWAYKITHHITAVDNHKKQSPIEEKSQFVARITRMKDCMWSADCVAPMAGAYVPLGRRYSLEAGLLEITYNSGARTLLEGPCTYKVESNEGGYLGLGKLTARVDHAKPQTANPEPTTPSSLFTIRTPTAVVTDLGTEFGVEVDETGNTISHVFRGTVRVQAAGGNGFLKDVVLHENESVRVSKIAGEDKPSITRLTTKESSRFLRNMPPPKSVRDSEAYAKLVLSLRPVVYYRMERPSAGQKTNLILDSSGGGHHGELRLGNERGQPYRRGRWGDAIWLRGPTIGDLINVPDYPKATEDKLSLSVWVLAESGMTHWPRIAANRGSRSSGQFNFGLYDRGEDGCLSVAAAPRRGKKCVIREKQRFPTFKWQHVAFVIDGTMLRLYRNGKEVARTECDGLLPTPTTRNMAIGGNTSDSGKELDQSRCWRGMIDELAVLNAALSVEQIQILNTGKPPIQPISKNSGKGRVEPNDAGETKKEGGD